MKILRFPILSCLSPALPSSAFPGASASASASSFSSSSSSSSDTSEASIQGSFTLSQHLFVRRGICAALRQRLQVESHQRGLSVSQILSTFEGESAKTQPDIVKLLDEHSDLCETIFQDLNSAVHQGLYGHTCFVDFF